MTETTVAELRAGTRLTQNNRLASSSGLTSLSLRDGRLALADSSTEEVRPGLGNQPVMHLLMQRDGNLVAYGQNRRRVWASSTSGHPGAVALVADDGNLVVQSAAGVQLWSSGEALDWRTVKSTDGNGYHYDTTSDTWKKACEALPCFAALAWPGYDTDVVEREINGQQVVVQLWKGRCQRFFGLPDFPGGIGAEVGIYKRDANRSLPARLPLLPRFLEIMVLARLRQVAQEDLWWAAPELGTTLEFSFINPITQQAVFQAAPEQTYWLNKWMVPADFGRYGQAQGTQNMPQSDTHYILEYAINGEPPQRWPGTELLLVGAYNPAQLELSAASPR